MSKFGSVFVKADSFGTKSLLISHRVPKSDAVILAVTMKPRLSKLCWFYYIENWIQNKIICYKLHCATIPFFTCFKVMFCSFVASPQCLKENIPLPKKCSYFDRCFIFMWETSIYCRTCVLMTRRRVHTYKHFMAYAYLKTNLEGKPYCFGCGSFFLYIL